MPTIDQAYDFYDAGELAKAAEACRSLLAQDPASFPVAFLLGSILGEEGDYPSAIDFLRQAVSLRPDVKAAAFNLASILVKAASFADALAEVSKLLDQSPDDPEARLLKATCHAGLNDWDAALVECRTALHLNEKYLEAYVVTGQALHGLGRMQEAVAALDKALSLDPENLAALQQRAVVHRDAGRIEAAFADLDRRVSLAPHAAEPYFARGAALLDSKRYEEALVDFSKAIALRPDYAEALSNRGVALRELKRDAESIPDFDKALALKPGFADALTNRGSALSALKRFEEALADQNAAIEASPALAEAYCNRGSVLVWLGRYREALDDQDRAIALNPQFGKAYYNRAAARAFLEDFAGAERDYERAIALNPDHAEAHFNMGMVQLLTGKMETGWANYEWRLKTQKHTQSSPFPQRHLTSLAEARGKTILVYWEQGLGDVIQFSRYIPLLVEAGAKVLFAPQPVLKKLLSSLEGPSVRLVSLADLSSPFDLQVALASLPYLSGATLATIPSPSPGLFVDSDRVSKWIARLGERDFRIGICWKGSSDYEGDAKRSFSVRNFERLASMPGVRLISLQKGEGAAQLQALPQTMQVEDLGADFDSGPDAFLDTAAVMTGLDLVITSDTSVAHVAGALGVPVWVALPRVPDFRWLMEGTHSPWYPTMRLFRQKTDGNWPGVFAEIEAAVAGLLGSGAAL